MKTLFRLLLVLLLSSSFISFSQESIEKEDWAKFFNEAEVNGCMILFDTKTDVSKYYNEKRCDSTYLPASTFKIINSLIALETNAVDGIYDSIKWDGIDRGWPLWNQDQCMNSALGISCVWFYQELARRVGKVNMQYWLDKVAYGNQTMGAEIDNFWLRGDIRISANGQVEFLKRLINNELPFDIEHQETVKSLMLTDSTESYKVYSKTGWAMRIERQIGWLVGFVETKDNTYIFALNFDMHKDSDAKYRKDIVYDILKAEEII